MSTKTIKIIVIGLLALVLLAGLTAGAMGAILATTKIASTFLVSDAGARAETSQAGLIITAVDPGGPAAQAGVERGDLLLRIDGQEVGSLRDIQQVLENHDPGDEVELTVKHGDDLRKLTTRLGERRERASLGLSVCCGAETRLGAEVSPFDRQGSMILEVVPGSPAEMVDLRVGDRILSVDDQQPSLENDLAQIIGTFEPEETVTLQVARPGQRRAMMVEVTLSAHPDDRERAFLGVRFAPILRPQDLEPPVLPEEGFRFNLPPSSGPEFEFFSPPFEGEDFVHPPLGEFRTGLIVREVVEGGPADEAGLIPRDIITALDGEPIESPEAFSQAIVSRRPGQRVALTLLRRGEVGLIQIEVSLGENPAEAGAGYLGLVPGAFIRFGSFRGSDPQHQLDPHHFFEGFPEPVPPEFHPPLTDDA